MIRKNSKFLKVLFVSIFIFYFCILNFCFLRSAYALQLDTVKVNFLKGDYKAAIAEGEGLLANDASASHSDELYYLLGVSYMKDENYLRASDIFEIIVREFKRSAFSDQAQMGLGDTYFLRGDFASAENYYRGLLAQNPGTKLKCQLFWRLSQIGYKKGDTQQGKEYLDDLKKDFPFNLELLADKDVCVLTDTSSESTYKVQVGSFSNGVNARNLTQKLSQKGYPAYIEEVNAQGAVSYRVRVGKSRSRREIEALANKLSQEGYPVKICP